MRCMLVLVLSLFGFVAYARADEWREVKRLESAHEITWMDIDLSGDGVLYVCDWHDAYLYTAKGKKLIPVVPPTDAHHKSYTGYVSNGIFLGKQWILHGGFGKYSCSSTGKVVPLHVNQILGAIGIPKFSFVKAKGGDKALFYLNSSAEIPANSHIGSMVYIVSRGEVKSSFIHARDVEQSPPVRVEAVAITQESDYAFTAGEGFVMRWTTAPIAHSAKMNAKRKRGNFDLPSGVVASMVATKDVVAVAMKNGPVVFSANMQGSAELSIDSKMVAEKSSMITNYDLAMSDNGQIVFVARDRSTNKSEMVHEVVSVGPDYPYKQVLTSDSGITKVQLADEHTLLVLDTAGVLVSLSLASGAVHSEPVRLKTGLPDTKSFLVSGDGNTIVVYGAKAMVIYHRNGKEGFAAK